MCSLQDVKIPQALNIQSDVHYIDEHPSPFSQVPSSTPLLFPLQICPVLCTQGFNGELTHFQLGTYHAIDFACAIGTNILAVADAVVISAGEFILLFFPKINSFGVMTSFHRFLVFLYYEIFLAL